jgi:hypothetical protein
MITTIMAIRMIITMATITSTIRSIRTDKCG